MTTSSWEDARKSYLTSLRARLKKAYALEAESDSTPDKRWLNGFMAAWLSVSLHLHNYHVLKPSVTQISDAVREFCNALCCFSTGLSTTST